MLINAAFQTFRPSGVVTGTENDKAVEPSYAPLTLPMLAYVGCQALVWVGSFDCAVNS